MTSLLPRPSMALPDLFRMFESEWPFGERHSMRVEAFTDEGDFVVRCELPGIDPENIHINVEGNQLKIDAVRKQEHRAEAHSEFYYGSYSRTMLLPSSCDTDNINAEYENGILTIRIPRREAEASKEIPVARKGK
ncbi:heat shock protein Hsp20 [Saccharopolyspora erythraea NRRL 2338]|uniref:Small heat shock protein n=2 Tax=Saccharopolyspora erythraea TaxID=1836 RepID=A4FCG1_SACEN|nr:Hsp20/alpha crystallin family protein [Saccharopolyspora erythraea]EQD83908.1 heat-shock protein [Saccharopolyspora erythraea D]PFG95499.1 heat shock protein Hsp20 [Saccharopolyspora erythraea NRRL 2338]QRK92126.1 Hsp20/alpha crystallin family protein [Saccharopolyspora erythraea]CAM01736.1 small heat shock protein [Saccharopolyspora erythraea NRRL 2338]